MSKQQHTSVSTTQYISAGIENLALFIFMEVFTLMIIEMTHSLPADLKKKSAIAVIWEGNWNGLLGLIFITDLIESVHSVSQCITQCPLQHPCGHGRVASDHKHTQAVATKYLWSAELPLIINIYCDLLFRLGLSQPVFGIFTAPETWDTSSCSCRENHDVLRPLSSVEFYLLTLSVHYMPWIMSRFLILCWVHRFIMTRRCCFEFYFFLFLYYVLKWAKIIFVWQQNVWGICTQRPLASGFYWIAPNLSPRGRSHILSALNRVLFMKCNTVWADWARRTAKDIPPWIRLVKSIFVSKPFNLFF